MIEVVKLDYREYDLLVHKIRKGLRVVDWDSRFGSDIMAVDAEFKRTTNLREAKYLMADNYYGLALIEVKPDGTMVKIEEAQ